MADDDIDDNAAVDEDAYDISSVTKKAKTEDAALTAMREAAEAAAAAAAAAAASSASESAPQWAQQWKSQQAQPARLTGVCAKWNIKKGYGFIKRDDDLPDVYVHQRELQKKGFRSLREGEPVEFDVGAMDDGKLQAVRVSGPKGVEVIGQSKQSDDESSDEDADTTTRRSAGGDATGAALNSSAVGATDGGSSGNGSGMQAKKKPALAFVPRAVKRPAPKPAAKPKAPAHIAGADTEA